MRALDDLPSVPPFSPELNPIEMVFSTIRPRLRSLAQGTVSALRPVMQSALDRATPSDALNCFRHAG